MFRLSLLPALQELPTPAVLAYAPDVEHNVTRAIDRIGDAKRWRAHIKTGRSRWAVRVLMSHGVHRFKASTSAELSMLLQAGARDVLLATPAIEPTATQVAALARQYGDAVVSVLVDDVTVASRFDHGELTAVVDVDTGMGRTGVAVDDLQTILQVADVLRARGVRVGGLHSYDGHLADLGPVAKSRAVSKELQALTRVVSRAEGRGHDIPEVTVGGSHTFDCHVDELHASDLSNRVTFGPGTLVLNDSRSLGRFPPSTYRAAFAVATRVVSSRPPNRVTIDAGLTSIQVDAEATNIRVIGHPEVEPVTINQEHTVLEWRGSPIPKPGTLLLLLPAHTDTTISQFDELLVVESDWTVHAERLVRRTAAAP